MKKSYRDDNGEKVFRYSIRKYHFGAASVAVAALMFFANGAVAASETITPTTASDIVKVDSDSKADGDPGTSDEEDSNKVSTRQPLELKSVDELKTQEAPVEENNQVQAAAESETTGVESNSAQPETNPDSQEAPQAEGEGKQDQSTHVSNQTSSTSLLQPRTLKNKQSDYDPIPLDDDEDDIRDEQFSEMPTTTIQPRSPRSVPTKTTGSSPYNDKYRYYFERGQDPENSQLPRYTYAFFNKRALIGRGGPDKVSRIKNYLEEEVTPTVDGFDWKVTVNKERNNLDGISFLFSVPNGQTLVENSVTVTQVDDAGTTVKRSVPKNGNDDHITASLKTTNAKEVTRGTPTNTNARGKGSRFGPDGSYDVSSFDRIWDDTAGQGNDSFHSRGQGNNNNAATGLQNDEERKLGDFKKTILNSSGGTVYSGKIAGNTSYTITFKTRGSNDLDKLVYFSAVKGSDTNNETYLAMLLHARTPAERGFADKTRFRLKGNGYYQVEQNTAYYTSRVLNSAGQAVKKEGANTAYSYTKYKDKPLDSGVKGVLTGNDTNDTDKAFDLDEYSYSEYVNDNDQVLNKDDLLAKLQDEQQTITWYKGGRQISKSDLTKDAISSSGVHTYRYRVSYKDNSFNEGEIHFVTKPKKPTIDTNLSTVAGTSTNVRVSNVDSNTTVELYKKGNNGQNDTLVSSISSGDQGGTVTFNNVTLDYGSYYVKQKANGTWYEQDGTKREGVYSDQSSEKDASRIVIERIGAIGGQNDTRWKDKLALPDVTDFNLPTGSEILIGFRAKSPKGIKSLTISGADNLEGKAVETYGRDRNDDQTILGVNLRSRGGNSGGYSITVTATDSLGNEKHYKMNIIFPPNSGSFEKNPTEDHVTSPEKLKGKALVPLATENPPIVIKAKGINVDTVNGIDNKHEWRAFLVDGGRNIQDSASGSQKAVDFKSHIVADTPVTATGTAEFISASQTGHFKREHLGRKPLRLVVAMVNKQTREIVDKYVSALSSDTLEATYPQFTKSPDFIKEPREITAKIGHLQADKAQIRYTNDAGTDKTVNFSKVNGNWEKDNPNQDSTIVVTEDTGTAGTATVHIPSGTAKGGTKIYARQKVDANTEYSEESSIDVPTGPTVQHPTKPEINQSQEDLDVTIKVGQGNANRATVVFTDSRGVLQSVMFSKTGNSWDKVQAQAAPDVSVTSTNGGTALIRIPYGVAKIGSQVVTNQREEGQTAASENASHMVQGDTTAPKVSLGDTLLPTTANAATTPIYKVVQGSAFTPKLKIWDNSGSIKNLDITGIPNGVTKQKFGNDFAEQTTAKQATPYSGSTLTGAAADTQSLGVHTAQITVGDKATNATTYYLKYEVYPARVEARQSRFGQVKDKALQHGENSANYIKFKNANGQEVPKPSGVDVTWGSKPSTAVAGLDKTGLVKVTYHVTDENGVVRDEVRTVAIRTPVYHATLKQNPFVTTYGREFISGRYPKDGRLFINYNGGSHFNLRNIRAYWEHSSGAGSKDFGDTNRPWNTNYLGKKREKLMVRYPGDTGTYRNSDDHGDRFEILDGTFIVKPLTPTVEAATSTATSLTVNNVNSGTTVELYDMSNPTQLRKIGETTVTKEGEFDKKDNVIVPLLAGESLTAGAKIVAKVVYTSGTDRTESDSSSKVVIKHPKPANLTSTVKMNGDYEFTVPTDADKVTFTIPTENAGTKTVTLTSENAWTSTDAAVKKVGDKLVIPNGTLGATNRTVNITETKGSGDAESASNNYDVTIPTHTAPTLSDIVIGAGATPTADQISGAFTGTTKTSLVAKSELAAVPAGTTATVPATLTYTDGSTEDVNVTVKSKPTAPTVNDLESRPNASALGLLSTARTISGTAMAGAEKVKLTLQNSIVKEITPQADGSWSYTLAADEFLTQTTSRFNAKYSSNQVKVVQVKNNVESEATNVGVVMGRAIVDTPLQAGRKITVHIPHDTTSGYIRIGGTTSTGGVDIGLKKVGDTWTLSTDANRASKLELVSEEDPTNPAMTKVTLKVKDTDEALYNSPFTIGHGRGNVKFRAHYYNGGNINEPVPSGRTSDLNWILSDAPTNTIPTVSWETGKEVQNGQKIPSPTVDELKDLFKGEDVEDDNGLTVGYAASNRGRLRVRVFTGRDIANNIEGTPVSAQANSRIAPGNYTLVLSTIDAARAESNLLERNVVIQSHADYYRDTVKYPTAEEKVTYNDAAITNGNFTPTAKTSFKDKIQELNGTVLPASTRYTVGTTDDKAKVAVINFPDGSTIDISHAVVAKPEVPTVTFTHDNKLSDADRTISGTALQNATKVTIQFQDGRGTQGRVDVTPVNGQWSYALPEGRYLRQTEQSSLPGSSTVPVRVTQTVFDATSDAASVYVAKDRNFTGKTITGVRGSAELEQLKSNPKDGVSYTERGTEQTFPSDFDATWKTTPDVTSIGTRTYIANIFEKDKVDRVSQEVTVKVVVKPSVPSLVTAVGKKDAGSVTVNGVNSGTTVALYDMTNPANPIELGRTDVPKDGDFALKDGVAINLAPGKSLSKDMPIAVRSIYKPTVATERVESDYGTSLKVTEGLKAKDYHLIKGENPTGELKDHLQYKDGTALPPGSTVEWKKIPDYSRVGDATYKATVTIPGSGSTEVTIPVHVYPTVALASPNGYNNKQGTLSHGSDAERYVVFKDGNQTVAKPAGVTVRWQGGTEPAIATASASHVGHIEVEYPSDNAAGKTVQTLDVALPTYHAVAKATEVVRTIDSTFASTEASAYVKKAENGPDLPQGTEYTWQTDETGNAAYGSGTWGKVNDDWLGKKTNKVKVYYPQVDGGNPKEDSLAEETEEITFVTKPATPSITTDLTGSAGTRKTIRIANATPGTTVELYNGDTKIGSVEVPKAGTTRYSDLTTVDLTMTQDIPTSTTITAKAVYKPTEATERVESDASAAKASTFITLSAKGSIQTMKGTGTLTELDNLNETTLAKLLRRSDAATDFTGATGRWKNQDATRKTADAGTRTETLLVRLAGQTNEQEVNFTFTTLAQPSAKAVVRSNGQDITNDNLSDYVTADGNNGLSWENQPAKVEVGKALPRIQVTYPSNGVAVSDVTTQYVTPKVYALAENPTPSIDAHKGSPLSEDASDYVKPASNTEGFPNGTTHAWKDGDKPSTDHVGEVTKTVVTTYGQGDDVPAELRGKEVETPVTITVVPDKPVVTPNTDGTVDVTVPEETTKVEVTYTPEGQDAPTTVAVTKNQDGSWTAPADSGITISPDGSKITVSADKLKDGAGVTAKGITTIGNKDFTSQPSDSADAKAPRLGAPTISRNTDYGIEVELDDKATHAEVDYVDAAGVARKLTFEKQANGDWEKTDHVAIGTVVTTGNKIVMQANTAKAGSTVTATQKSALSDSSSAANHKAIGLLNNPVVTPQIDSGVQIEAPSDATSLEVTYTPAGSQAPTKVTLTKGRGGNWTVPTGFEVGRDGKPVLKAKTAAAGTEVTVQAKAEDMESKPSTGKVKTAQPSTFTPESKQNGDVVIPLPADADKVVINYPESDTVTKTVELTKGADGNWSAPAGSPITVEDGKATVKQGTASSGKSITAQATAGTGTDVSAAREATITVPSHTKPTVSTITVEADSQPTADSISNAVTADRKKTAVAKAALPTVAAGTSQTVGVTVTYDDDSTEDVEVTVQAKEATPTTATTKQWQNGDVEIGLPDNANKASLTYTDKQGSSQTVELSKGATGWTVTSGDTSLLDNGKLRLKPSSYTAGQAVSVSATKGSGDTTSQASSASITPTAHTVTTNTLVKPYKQNVTDNDLLDAVNAEHKRSVKLKDGTSYPTTDGFHDIELTVTYEDGSMESVQAKYKVTDASKETIDQAAKAKKDEIDKRTDLTQEEKDKAKSDVDTAAEAAKKAIDGATTNAKVDEAKTNGKQASNNINPTGDKKSEAKKEIDQAAKAKKDEIDKRTDLTQEEKDKAKSDVDTAAEAAKKAIDDATTNAKVDEAKTNGKQAGNDINPQPAPRPDDSTNTNNGGNTNNGANTNSGGTTTPATPSSIVGQAQASTPAQETPVSPSTPNNSGTTVTPRETRPVDKSELARLVEELETRLKALDSVDSTVVESAKALLADIKQALNDESLAEEELRDIVRRVKDVLDSLKDVREDKQNQEKDQVKEKSQTDADLPYVAIVGSLLALLGLLLFLIARRKKESELKKLAKELTKVLQDGDLTSVDAKVLDQAREALAQAVAFLANEKESDHTEDELIEKLKAILAQLR
ncbi:surface anchored protein [Streptococcus pneumoniae]|nr:surface anchored protein [Streptococcus pneumoniae]